MPETMEDLIAATEKLQDVQCCLDATRPLTPDEVKLLEQIQDANAVLGVEAARNQRKVA